MSRTEVNSKVSLLKPNRFFALINSSRFMIIGLTIVIMLAVLGKYIIDNRTYTYQGSIIDPALPAPDFVITDQNGNIFQLSQQTGKVVLVFFGYTHCPDVCPVTMNQFKQIRARLGDQANEVRFVFITVDPERDTPDVIREYLGHFDPAIIGLSDDRSILETVWDAYSVTQVSREMDMSEEYMVDHTSRVYVIDKAGQLRITFPFGFDIQKTVEDIEQLLSENES